MITLTRNKAELLKIFFTNPEKSFYMQELGRILGKKPGVFQRTLNNLEREGILVSEYRASARYFMVNKDHPLYNEFKNIIFKTIGITGSIREAVLKAGKVDFCFIYGSFAKSTENYLSDVDTIIIGEVDEDKLIEKIYELENSLKREINYKIYSILEFKKEIENKNPFLLEILKDKKVMIIGTEDELRRAVEEQPYKKS